MAIDSYALCPCGSGKKIKFCCSKDILHEIEKIARAVNGEQYVSALDQATKAIQDKGPRAALLALQAETHLALNQVPEAEKATAKLLEVMPHSSVGLAYQAILSVINGEIDVAVKHLQQSIENVEQLMPENIITAVILVAQSLLRDGRVLAARGHLLLRVGLTGGADEESIKALTELDHVDRLPTILKQDFVFGTCPEGAPWQGEFDAAMKSARRGAWLAACESLESLDQKLPNQAAVLRNIAIMRGWLGQHQQAVNAWRKYIALPGVAEEDAVESEALCQVLERGDSAEKLDVLKISYPIRDTERLMEALLSDKNFDAIPVESYEGEEGQPPPKGAFKMLDRPMPATHEGLTHRDLPVLLGELYVHGKQTDRESRLEFILERSPRLDDAKNRLQQIAGAYLEPQSKEEIFGEVSSLTYHLNPRVDLPRDTPQERAMELMHAQRDDIYANVWPNLPRTAFNGRTAREAAQDPALRIRVLATILNLELATEEQFGKLYDFNLLRKDLALPERSSFQLPELEVTNIPAARMARLEFSNLSDDQLIAAFRLATLKNLRLAMRKSAEALVARSSVAEKVDLAEVYRLLVGIADDSDEALQFIDNGRKIAAAKGRSPADWYLLELQVRLSRYEAEECNRLTRMLATRYSKEPGISEGLYRVLVRYGVISPDGQPIGEAPTGPGESPQPAAAADRAESSGLWTPDSANQKQESKLWLPGMQ